MALVNASGIKEAGAPFRISHDFYEAVEQRVLGLMEEAKRRAERNGRTTLMPHDL
jgi:histone H3/H4